MSNIFKAVQILANNNPTLKMGVVQIGASLAAIGATEREKFRADADYWDKAEAAKTPAEHQALFMEALTKRLAVNGDETGIGLIEAAADEVLKCFEEREAHRWVGISYDCKTGVTSDYTTEEKAWHAARKALAGLFKMLDHTHREKYAGNMIFNTTRYFKMQKRAKPKEKTEWVHCPNAHQAIVPQEILEMVRQRRQKNSYA